MKRFVTLTGLLISAMASAEIYEVIDANGRKTYTDKAPHDRPDARPLEVAPQTGNAWSSDNLQQQNDRYYEELKRKQDEVKQQKETEEKQLDDKKQGQENAIAEAEKALEKARELKAGDYYRNRDSIGIHYTQQYRDRVKQAEDNLEKAREAAETQD